MGKILQQPLPIRDGLNPTRARVTPEMGPQRAWDFLKHLINAQRHRHPDDNDAALTARFNAGEVVLQNGQALKPDDIIATNRDVYFYRTPAPETPVPYTIHTVFEDENLLIVDKPPFMATMPRASHITETATVRLRRATGNNELSPAHRLDRLTSGILVFTKRREIRGAYQTLFAAREVSKTYEAISVVQPLSTPVVWHSRMTKVPGEIQGHNHTDGEPNAHTELVAITPLSAAEQRVVEAVHGPCPPLARYTLRPRTGKTHQLRLHMWAADAPILGDPVYPITYPVEAEDMAVPMHLTARSIAFTDPLTGQPREFTTPLDLLDRIATGSDSGSLHF